MKRFSKKFFAVISFCIIASVVMSTVAFAAKLDASTQLKIASYDYTTVSSVGDEWSCVSKEATSSMLLTTTPWDSSKNNGSQVLHLKSIDVQGSLKNGVKAIYNKKLTGHYKLEMDFSIDNSYSYPPRFVHFNSSAPNANDGYVLSFGHGTSTDGYIPSIKINSANDTDAWKAGTGLTTGSAVMAMAGTEYNTSSLQSANVLTYESGKSINPKNRNHKLTLEYDEGIVYVSYSVLNSDSSAADYTMDAIFDLTVKGTKTPLYKDGYFSFFATAFPQMYIKSFDVYTENAGEDELYVTKRVYADFENTAYVKKIGDIVTDGCTPSEGRAPSASDQLMTYDGSDATYGFVDRRIFYKFNLPEIDGTVENIDFNFYAYGFKSGSTLSVYETSTVWPEKLTYGNEPQTETDAVNTLTAKSDSNGIWNSIDLTNAYSVGDVALSFMMKATGTPSSAYSNYYLGISAINAGAGTEDVRTPYIEITYKANGNNVSSIADTCEYVKKNIIADDGTVCAVYGVYDSQYNLLKAVVDETAEISAKEIKIPFDLTDADGAKYVKLFVLESLGSLTPITSATELNVQ